MNQGIGEYTWGKGQKTQTKERGSRRGQAEEEKLSDEYYEPKGNPDVDKDDILHDLEGRLYNNCHNNNACQSKEEKNNK